MNGAPNFRYLQEVNPCGNACHIYANGFFGLEILLVNQLATKVIQADMANGKGGADIQALPCRVGIYRKVFRQGPGKGRGFFSNGCVGTVEVEPEGEASPIGRDAKVSYGYNNFI